jgi:HlyD family secretion protein
MKRTLRRIVTGVVLAAGGYAAWHAWHWWRPVDGDGGALGQIPTAVATERDIVVSVSATGLLQPVRIVEVKSKAAGEIVNMPVDIGDYVNRNALVAQVDTETLIQELQQAQADLTAAETDLAVTSRQFERATQLYDRQLISRSDLEDSERNLASARAQRLRAQADVNLRQERLDDATVRAPIGGTVIAKQVEEGQIIQSSVNNVSGGTTLVQMADLGELEIRTLVDEIDIGQVRPGMKVESTVEAFPSRQFTGTVIKIEPQAVVENQVTTFPVLSRIDNSEGLLLPGMTADVAIIVHRRTGVLAVPNEAIREPSDAEVVSSLLGLEVEISEMDAPLPASSAGADARSNRPPGAARGRQNDEADRVAGALDAFGIHGPPERAIVFAVPETMADEVSGPRYEVRPVLVGARDWEHAEVISGLKPGDRVVLLPSTSLLQSQEELRERFSRRSAVPGMGR